MMKTKRRPYKWGAKAYLASFKIGETRLYKEHYAWRSLSSIASVMNRQYGCKYSLWTDNEQRMITRVI